MHLVPRHIQFYIQMVSLSLLIQVIPEVTGSSLLSVMDRLAFEVAPDAINKTVTNLGNDNSSCTQGMPKLLYNISEA